MWCKDLSASFSSQKSPITLQWQGEWGIETQILLSMRPRVTYNVGPPAVRAEAMGGRVAGFPADGWKGSEGQKMVWRVGLGREEYMKDYKGCSALLPKTGGGGSPIFTVSSWSEAPDLWQRRKKRQQIFWKSFSPGSGLQQQFILIDYNRI